MNEPEYLDIPDFLRNQENLADERKSSAPAPNALLRGDAETAIGAWLSAALEDPSVCAEMKRDIVAWFAFLSCEDARSVAEKIISTRGEEFACAVLQELELAL